MFSQFFFIFAKEHGEIFTDHRFKAPFIGILNCFQRDSSHTIMFSQFFFIFAKEWEHLGRPPMQGSIHRDMDFCCCRFVVKNPGCLRILIWVRLNKRWNYSKLSWEVSLTPMKDPHFEVSCKISQEFSSIRWVFRKFSMGFRAKFG